MILAFTAPPEPKEILLSDLKWINPPNHDHIWICVQGHPSLKDRVFYVNTGKPVAQYFCNLTTWTAYTAQNFGHIIDHSKHDLFLALYKVITMQYYEEN